MHVCGRVFNGNEVFEVPILAELRAWIRQENAEITVWRFSWNRFHSFSENSWYFSQIEKIGCSSNFFAFLAFFSVFWRFFVLALMHAFA